MAGVGVLSSVQVRSALRTLGESEDDTGTATPRRRLSERLRSYGTVRSLLEQAPEAAREAFLRLVENGPAPVEEILGRGWWGRGTLPPPLDWLQARALVVVTDGATLHAVDEAVQGLLELTLDIDDDQNPPERAGEAVVVEAVSTVVVAPSPASLNRAIAAPGAQLRGVAATVAVSPKTASVVAAALRSAGVSLADDAVVAASQAEPALPGTVEEAAAPRAIRALLERAVAEQRQVRLEYYPSSRAGAKTDRIVDPWSFGDDLLRGYCHLRAGERSFAVDRIGRARLLASAVEHGDD